MRIFLPYAKCAQYKTIRTRKLILELYDLAPNPISRDTLLYTYLTIFQNICNYAETLELPNDILSKIKPFIFITSIAKN